METWNSSKVAQLRSDATGSLRNTITQQLGCRLGTGEEYWKKEARDISAQESLTRLFPKPHERLVSSAHRERELMPMSGQGGGQRLLSMD